jgi:hypothetical protein
VTLDNALNTSAIEIFDGPVIAQFAELEPDYSNNAGTTESIRLLGQQIGPNGYTVVHSMDDGLPDPVTSTNSNDASGSLQMDLVGRPPATADSNKLTWNAGTTSGSGTGTTITTTMPGDPAFWDWVIVALTVSSDTLVTETSMPADSLFSWKLIADVSDGGAVHTYVFGRKHYTLGSVPPVFKLDASAGYSWVIGSIDCGRTPSNDVLVPITPGDVEVAAESASVTTHNQTPVTIVNRGWNVGVFGAPSTAGVWTSTGNTIVAQTSGGGVSVALVRSGLRSVPGAYQMAGNTASATAVAAMIHIAFEVRDRPAMDAVNYFSTFNADSPIYGFERDTAPVTAFTRHIDPVAGGQILTQIYAGQMAGVSIDGRTATMSSVSKTRLDLDGSKTLPTVYGWREGCTTDWLAGWLLAQGGQYIGVPPSVYTRWWMPGYGSLHPYAGGSAEYTEVREWNTSRPGGDFRRNGTDTTGPFATAMYAQQTDSSVIRVSGTTDRNWATEIPGIDSPLMKDLFSKKNSKGQLTFWIRTDPWVNNPTAVTSGNPDDTLLFQVRLWNSYLNVILPGLKVNINTDGSITVWLGSQGSNLVGGGLTGDSQWHFFGYYWDYANAVGQVRWDDAIWNPINGNSNLDPLPADDATMYASGGYNVLTWTSHLPIADMQLETGINDFSRFRPNPVPNATYRPTRQPLAVIANPTPVQGWPTLQDLAQSTLAHLRCDEKDNAWFVPLDYFGETAQMTVTTLNVLDTDFNAGELSLVDDPTQTRNVVTVQYADTSVGSNRSSILEMTTSLAVPRGVTYVTFPLDVPTAETHGAAQWWTTTPEFQKLTAAQIAGTSAIQNENVMTVNTLPDGTGTVFTSTAFTARIYDWDSTSIVVQFTNTYSGTLYLANNGTNVPFLRALGYAISTIDGYVTVSDPGSIGTRRERALTTQLNWVTDRQTAQQVASLLVTILARPRPQITVTVQGDPRRKPGDLCQLVDSTGMKADGTWRVYRVQHNYNGPQYTQDVTLLRVGLTAVWDQGTWDESVWGV